MNPITKFLCRLAFAAIVIGTLDFIYKSLTTLFQQKIPKTTESQPHPLQGRVSTGPSNLLNQTLKKTIFSEPNLIKTQNNTIKNPGTNCFMHAFIQDFLGDPTRYDWFLGKLIQIADLSRGREASDSELEDEFIDTDDTSSDDSSSLSTQNLDNPIQQAALQSIALLKKWKTTNLEAFESRELRSSFIALMPPTPTGAPPFDIHSQEDAQEFRIALLNSVIELAAKKSPLRESPLDESEDEYEFFDAYSNQEDLDQATLPYPWAVTITESTTRRNPEASYIDFLRSETTPSEPEKADITNMFQYIDYNMHKKNEWPVEQVETKSTTLQEIQIPINQKIETSPLYFFPITHNFVDIAKYCLELEDQDEGKTGYDKKEKPLLLREVTQSITWPNTLLLHFNLGCQTAYTQSKYTSIDYQFSDAENWIIDLSTAKKPCKYQLESFIVHSGHILQAGHYYTIRREENFNGEKQWIEYNDGHSSLVSPKEIENFLHGKKGATTPYLMTFKKIYI